MSAPFVLLNGYYGEHNLGDDLLMLVTYRLLREVFEPSEIAVRSMGGSYIPKLLGESCAVAFDTNPLADTSIPFHTRIHVLGGGGFLFDYRDEIQTSLFDRIEHALLHRIGIVPLEHLRALGLVKPLVRYIRGRSRPRPEWLIALGLGIGPFPKFSHREIASAALLKDARIVMLRDEHSTAYCHRWRLPGRIVPGTDLVYLRRYWLGSIERPTKIGLIRKIGIVLRSWWRSEAETAYLSSVEDLVAFLRSEGCEITYFLFCPESLEAQRIHRTIRDETVEIWEPDHITVRDYITKFSQMDMVLTARAHGAIIAGCLGIPHICIGYMDKLQIVSSITGGDLWNPPFDFDEIKRIWRTLQKHFAEIQDRLDQRTRMNEHALDAALADVLPSLSEVAQKISKDYLF